MPESTDFRTANFNPISLLSYSTLRIAYPKTSKNKTNGPWIMHGFNHSNTMHIVLHANTISEFLFLPAYSNCDNNQYAINARVIRNKNTPPFE